MLTLTKKALLAAAVASLGATAVVTPAAAQGYWGYGGWRGFDVRPVGRPVGELFERERRMDQWLRNGIEQERIDDWRGAQLRRQLDGVRRWTVHEAREHRGFLPEDDYTRIWSRLDDLAGQIREAQE